MKKVHTLMALAALGLGTVMPPAGAQDFPNRTITVVVPFAAGGLTDQVARIAAQQMSESMGQPVVVDNKAGGNGQVAASFVKQARPDGYTLMVASAGTHAINQSLYAKLTYDPVKDFDPVTLLYKSTHFLLVPASSPARTVADVVAAARAKPGLVFASSGTGSGAHLSGELFKSIAKVEISHIAYKGSAAAIPDVVGGRVDMFFDGTTSAPLVREGKLRALAVTDTVRSPALPDVPTMAEAGFPGVEVNSWFGIITPAGTPAPVINKLAAEFDKAMRSATTAQKTSPMGITVLTGTPQAFAAHIASETERLGKIVKASGARAE
jgi:tripartite-type tricarboxylate transporter receptor subunit TctC